MTLRPASFHEDDAAGADVLARVRQHFAFDPGTLDLDRFGSARVPRGADFHEDGRAGQQSLVADVDEAMHRDAFIGKTNKVNARVRMPAWHDGEIVDGNRSDKTKAMNATGPSLA